MRPILLPVSTKKKIKKYELHLFKSLKNISNTIIIHGQLNLTARIVDNSDSQSYSLAATTAAAVIATRNNSVRAYFYAQRMCEFVIQTPHVISYKL